MEPIIIYEDNHLIAVNKPAGWLVQGDETGDMTLGDWVKYYIKNQYDKPGDVFLGTIHRLDRPVSGVVVFARTSKALSRMNEIIRDRKVSKKYWAVVERSPDPLSGKLEHYILKDHKKNKVKAFDKPSKSGAKKAELSYQLEAGISGHYLLDIDLKTGRPHQIRAQLAKMGMPIRGDVKYGAHHPNDDLSINLHCKSMSFVHPVKKEPISIECNPGDQQIWNLFFK